MRRHRNAKIVATLGPASSSPEMIRSLFEAGADVFRLNFSHGTREDHKKRYDLIRAIERDTGRPIGVLADLQGPKLRLGTFSEGRVTLKTGDGFDIDLDGGPGDQQRVGLPHPEIFQALCPGVQLLLDDGKVRLEVEACSQTQARTKVLVGGALSDRKGVSVVGAVLPLSALTAKDRVDLSYALELGVDWVALSFVQRPEDVEEIRGIVANRAGVMSKLEKPSAVEHLDAIVALSDAVMVARGDLGVENGARRSAAYSTTRRSSLSTGRQTQHCRNADAGIDDSGPNAHARGSFRRRLGHLSRGRCGHAFSGVSIWTVPVGSGVDDEPHHYSRRE
jgi:pyruvate kinase